MRSESEIDGINLALDRFLRGFDNKKVEENRKKDDKAFFENLECLKRKTCEKSK